MPIIVLPLICLIVSGVLTVSNSFTQPVIEKAAAERAAAARREVIPQAEEFELLETNGLPKTVTAVYRATNNSGYIFMITTMGYGGEISLICGINIEGKIIKTVTLAQTETKGLASPVFELPYESQYIGKDKNLDGVSGISGATISSTAYKNGIRDAFAAYEKVKGVR